MSKQVGGSHYSKYEIEPIDFINKNNLSYMQGNAIKYVTRYKDKNGIEDLEKAKHYIDMMINEYEQGAVHDVKYTAVSDEYVYEYLPFNELRVGNLFRTNGGTVMEVIEITTEGVKARNNEIHGYAWYTSSGVFVGRDAEHIHSYKGAR